MATVTDYVNAALRKIGQLAEGETPSGETSADALEAFNDMIDSWNTERLSVYTTQDETFTWTANQASRTMGPTGNFVTARPVLLDDSTYFNVDDLSYGLTLINRAQYSSIAQKDSTSTMPQVLFVDMTMPDATLYLWPVPTQDIEFHAVSVVPLDEYASLATTVVVPPGYRRAFKANLAVEIAVEFGLDPVANMPTLVALARKSKANIKRINNPNDLMSMPGSLVSRRGSGFNIWTGLPQ